MANGMMSGELAGFTPPAGPGMRNQLLGLASGVLGSVGRPGFGMGEGFRNMMMARQLDEKQHEKSLARAGTAHAIQAGGLEGMSPAMRTLAATNPAFAQQMLLTKYKTDIANQLAAKNRWQLVDDEDMGRVLRQPSTGNIKAAPTSFERRKELQAAGAPEVNVNTKGANKFAEGLSEDARAAQQAAAAARTRIRNNMLLRSTLGDPNVYTGAGGETINRLKQAGQTLFGLDFKGVAPAEIASRVSKRIGIGLQKELPVGKLTDKDMTFLLSLPPGLTTSPEGNQLLLDLSDLNQRHKVEMAQTWRQSQRPDGSFDPGVYDELDRVEDQFGTVVQDYVGRMREIAKRPTAQRRSPLAGIPVGEMNRSQLNLFVQNKGPKNLTDSEFRAVQQRLQELGTRTQ